MGHPRLRLSVFSRQLLVRRVAGGWPVAHVAEQLGISRATAYKWVRRYRVEGERGLLDRSSRPHRSPRRLSKAAEAEILAARAGNFAPAQQGRCSLHGSPEWSGDEARSTPMAQARPAAQGIPQAAIYFAAALIASVVISAMLVIGNIQVFAPRLAGVERPLHTSSVRRRCG